ADTVTKIEKCSFSGDTGLAYVKIGTGLSTCGFLAFENVVFTLPNGVTVIDPSVDTISGRTFERAAGSLKLVSAGTYPDHVEWAGEATTGTLTLTGGGKMTERVSAAQYSWSMYKAYVKRLVVLDGVTSIGAYAFKGYTKLVSVELSDTVASISKYAFDGSTGITHVSFGLGLTTMSSVAFSVTFHKTSSASKTVSVSDLKGHVFEGKTKLIRMA
ncbi:MAG: leucine-rich repeat domain-containing protein, partial [archaeon]|nr:leucine-rich repeat domain-containing protein [archaeon]